MVTDMTYAKHQIPDSRVMSHRSHVQLLDVQRQARTITLHNMNDTPSSYHAHLSPKATDLEQQ